MSLKKKLFIIYALAIIIPLLIFGVGMTVINNKVIKEVQSEFTKQESNFDWSNEKRFIKDIEIAAKEDIELALNTSFTKLIFDKFRDLSQLRIYYNGNEIAYHERAIPDERAVYENNVETIMLYDDEIKIEYEYTQRFKLNPERRLQGIFFNRFLVSIVIYLFLHGMFIYYILKNTIPHLDKLKTVAETIGEGDFEFAVDTSRKDEIGQVYKAFDNMRASLQSYENNRKELITNISHDLKTPIATIKGYISGIKDGLANTPEKLDKYLEIIYNNSNHLDSLIDDLFLYSKLDVGKVDFDFTQLHFDKYIDYYIDELKLDLEEKNIEIKWELPKLSTTVISGDGFKIKRVLNNIITNSIKHFDKKHKCIEFKLSGDDEALQLDVIDNGSGIPEDKINSIFNRFYRADDSRNTNQGSSGLGLAIAKQIIENHGGEISARSTLGEGTTITIKLPVSTK